MILNMPENYFNSIKIMVMFPLQSLVCVFPKLDKDKHSGGLNTF